MPDSTSPKGRSLSHQGLPDTDSKKGGSLSQQGVPKETNAERLTVLLAEQMERGNFQEARETVTVLLRLRPNDKDALDILAMLDEQMETVTSGQVGELHRFKGHKAWVNSVAFAPNGRRAVSGAGGAFVNDEFADGNDTSVLLWDVENGQKLHRFRGHRTVVNCVAFSPDGRRIASGGRRGAICLWDGTFLTAIRQFQRTGQAVWTLAFSPDGRLLLSGGDERAISLWNVREGRCLRRFEGHRNGVNSVAFSPDGRRALSGSFDNSIRLWDVETGQMLRSLEGHAQAVLSVAFTPDGNQAVSGSVDRTVRLWDLEHGQEVRRLKGHGNRVNSVAVASEGRFVLSGSGDKTVRLWDLTTGRELRRFQGHKDAVLSVAFSPDGQLALSGGRDRTLRLWQLPNILDVLNPNEWAFNLTETLRESGLLDPAQLTELTSQLQAKFTESRALAWHLIELGWVTTYQINQLVLGRGRNLRLGQYVVLDRLGEGGMGTVFKGHDPGNNRLVALKVARSEAMRNPEDIRQFWWENEVVARLSHPNVVKTFGAGEDGDRRFFAMEYIEGTDLDKMSRQVGPLPIAQACDLIRQAALGLQHAHDHKLVHRDIKPANLLLTTAPLSPRGRGVGGEGEKLAEHKPPHPDPLPHGERGSQSIKLIDWGLADLRGKDESGSPLPKGEMVGTIDFMAPEQAADPGTADIRADIYSLGCTLFQLLTGKPPFPSGSLMQKLVKHQQVEPPTLYSLRPDVPSGLQEVMSKLLAKQPSDRYQTPGEVAAALKAFC
jgi:WD40 repeat protein